MTKSWLVALFLFGSLPEAAATAEPVAEEADAILRGQVLGPDEVPVAGATVHACTVEEILYGSTGEDEPPCVDPEPVTTDAGGYFVFDSLWPNWYEIRARHPGLADGAASRVRAAPGDVNEPLKLRLLHGAVVTGRVVDEDAGTPVAGAEIEGRTSGGVTRTVSEPDGTFKLAGMGAGRGGIWAKAPGYWLGSTFLQVGGEQGMEGRVLPITMRKKEPDEPTTNSEGMGGVIPAEVDPPGTVKVTGIFRDLSPDDIPFIVMTRGLWPWRANRNLDGSWWIEDLSPGTWTVRAHLGRGMEAPRFSKTVEIPAGVTEVHLELRFADGETAQEAP